MIQQTLGIEKVIIGTKAMNPKFTCRFCEHRVILDYRSGKRFNYCGLTRDSRTDNGLHKLKNLRGSCLLQSNFKNPKR